MKIKSYFILLSVILVVACNSSGLTPTVTISENAPATIAVPDNTPTIMALSPSPDTHRNYIGLTYPPLPGNLMKGPGMMFSPPLSDQWWSISVIRDNDLFMLWFEKILYYDSEGKAHVQVSDVLVLPSPVQGQKVLANQCSHAGILDSEVVVLARVDEESIIHRYLPNSNIILAWRANQTTGRFEIMSTTRIDCYAETFLSYPWETP